MVQLGRHYGTGPASLAEIAVEEDLPRAYLEQLVVGLREIAVGDPEFGERTEPAADKPVRKAAPKKSDD